MNKPPRGIKPQTRAEFEAKNQNPVIRCTCLQHWNTCAGKTCGPWKGRKEQRAFEKQMQPWWEWWDAAEREQESTPNG